MKIPFPACDRFAVLICRIAKTIDTSQARTGRSDESTRCQVKDTISQSEVFMLLDLINGLICIDQISHPGLSLPPLECFHNELRRVKQLVCCPLRTASLLGGPRWIRMIANFTELGIPLGTLTSSTCGSGNSSSGMSAPSGPFPHLRPFDCVALHSSDHRLCSSACVPTRGTPICIRESFHRSMNMLVRALPHDKFRELWTVCQIPDGSLGGSSAPRILDPEHAQV